MPKNNKIKQSKEALDLFKFFDIKLLDEKELKKLTEDKRRQYLCRLQRWDSCLETQLDFEKYKTKSLINYGQSLIDATNHFIEQFKNDPKLEDQFQRKSGLQLAKVEKEINQLVRNHEIERQKFFDLFIDKTKIKERKDLDELDVKPFIKKEIKSEIKEESDDEIDYKPRINKKFKEEIKEEYEEDIDIKPFIKKEVKIKEEMITSDEETDY